VHEKEGREHWHIVWTRIDFAKLRTLSDSHNYASMSLLPASFGSTSGIIKDHRAFPAADHWQDLASARWRVVAVRKLDRLADHAVAGLADREPEALPDRATARGALAATSDFASQRSSQKSVPTQRRHEHRSSAGKPPLRAAWTTDYRRTNRIDRCRQCPPITRLQITNPNNSQLSREVMVKLPHAAN
jgi:hypothetical protein